MPKHRRDAERVFLMVSGTLNRTTNEIAKVRRALGNRFAGLFDHMPPHTPRHGVIEAAEMTREAGADLIVTVGGGSITDGAKAVQLCLANDVRNAEAIDGFRPVKGPDGALGLSPDMKPPSSVPTTLSAGEFSAYSGITDERHPDQGIVPPPADHSARGSTRPGRHRAHSRMTFDPKTNLLTGLLRPDDMIAARCEDCLTTGENGDGRR